MGIKPKSVWILFICMLAGLTVGDFIGEMCDDIYFLNFLNYSQNFGLASPLSIDLGMLMMTIQVQINFTLAGIIGLVIGIIGYKRI